MIPKLRPRPWRAPTDLGLTGPFARNERLAGAELWEVPGFGPEDVLVDDRGRVLCGIADGRILRFPAGGGAPEVVAETGGRPLGLQRHPDGSLIVCDAERGLLRVIEGRIEVLADAFEGQRLRFVNNAAVAGDGTIYFSDTSRRYGLASYRSDLIEHSNTGRLFRRRPDGEIALLLDGLSFANGVTLAPDEDWLLVAETGEYRLRRLHLRGPLTGTDEVFAENLPGMPDNLSTGPSGTLWAPMVNRRNRMLDRVLPHPRLRAVIHRLPDRLQPQPARYGIVFGFAPDGKVRFNLQDPTGRLAMISGATEHDGWLYLGSLTEPFVGRVRIPG